jgi:hypothetical protein
MPIVLFSCSVLAVIAGWFHKIRGTEHVDTGVFHLASLCLLAEPTLLRPGGQSLDLLGILGPKRVVHRCRLPVLRTWLVVSLGMDLPPFARSWLQQRELGASALQAIEDAELRRLDPATALAQTEMLLSAVRLADLPEERRISSGFVEQQRLFARARR